MARADSKISLSLSLSFTKETIYLSNRLNNTGKKEYWSQYSSIKVALWNVFHTMRQKVQSPFCGIHMFKCLPLHVQTLEWRSDSRSWYFHCNVDYFSTLSNCLRLTNFQILECPPNNADLIFCKPEFSAFIKDQLVQREYDNEPEFLSACIEVIIQQRKSGRLEKYVISEKIRWLSKIGFLIFVRCLSGLFTIISFLSRPL